MQAFAATSPRFKATSNTVLVVIACLAIGLPTLIAYNAPPSATFLNQAAAFLGWGSFLLLLSVDVVPGKWPWTHGFRAAAAALTLLVGAALAAPLWASLPWPLALSNAGTLLAAALALLVAASLTRQHLGPPAFRAFCIGLVVAGMASSTIGIVQVYFPQGGDGTWIAPTHMMGRAIGNMRQPNHLSSLLLWSIVAAIWLGEDGRLRRLVAIGLALLFLFVVVLSGSRTGALGTLTLAAWGLLDRRLSRPARTALLLAPLAYALLWHGAAEWAQYSQQVFGAAARFNVGGDVSSSRFAIWSNTVELIRANPWLGVGFGEFNFAWTLTPFPDRPIEFFDHCHNFVLQLMVELGVPLATVVLGLFGWSLVSAVRHAVAAGRGNDTSGAPMQRAAVVIVLLVGVHSMLEYPLWYAYFLLPTAFALGLCLAVPSTSDESPEPGNGREQDASTDRNAAVPSRVAAHATPVSPECSTPPGGATPMPSAAPAHASFSVAASTAPTVAGSEGAAAAAHQASPGTAPVPAQTLGTAAASASTEIAGRSLRFDPAQRSDGSNRHPTRPLVLCSLMLIGGAALAVLDYWRVVAIFSPPASAPSLGVRIDEGRESVLFAHHADYAGATVVDPPSQVMFTFKSAPHYLLDWRLMIVWATALDEVGETDKARHLAARLREFRHPQAAPFFAACEAPSAPGAKRPFQCEPAERTYSFRDFR